MRKDRLLVFLLLIFSFGLLFSAETQKTQDELVALLAPPPIDSGAVVNDRLITELSKNDPAFAEYRRQFELASKKVKLKAADFIPAFFLYVPGPDDTVLSVAENCKVPYETVATLNGISSFDESIEGRILVLAAAPGIFVAESPATLLETFVFSDNPAAWSNVYPTAAEPIAPDEPGESDGTTVSVVSGATPAAPPAPLIYEHITIGGRRFAWNGSVTFSDQADMFFRDPGFVLPLDSFRITSRFGPRRAPTGTVRIQRHHTGIDLAAVKGTPVKATKNGVVSEIHYNTKYYGNYVVIRHVGNIYSLYGHLSTIDVEKDQEVTQETVIGQVGRTGQATGPHLHFEIRFGNTSSTAQDPAKFVKGLL